MIALLLACVSSGGTPEDSATDTAAVPVDACDPVAGGDGSVDEPIACTDGRCSVPVGTAWRGAADPEHPERCPLQQVDLSGFAIGQTEVTVDQWAACVAAGACDPQPTECAPSTSDPDGDALPVVCVDWSQADGYCAWAGGRLPTEAEWEKAARGSEAAAWPWGELSPTCNLANFRFVSSYCEGSIVAVGSRSFGASPYGLDDVAGNAWEWVADWYDAEAYRHSDTTDPGSPEQCHPHVGDPATTCTDRVIRGGAWNTTEDTIRPAARSFAAPDTQDVNIGFRCAWDL